MDMQYARLVKKSALCAVMVSCFLCLIKTIAWWQTDSVSVLASIFDSAFDLIISSTNFFIIRYAIRPADKEHTFGHGKAESLAALVQSALIIGAAIFLFVSGLARFHSPQPLQSVLLGFVIISISLLFSLGLVYFQHSVIKKTGSLAIKADMLHYQTDAYVNGAVLIALLFMWHNVLWVDGALTLCISFYIFYSALRMGFEAIQALLDRSLPSDEIAKINTIVMSTPKVIGVHNIRTRQSGMTTHIQLHLELADELPLVQAHEITDAVEYAILLQYPRADIIIHQYPSSVAHS